MLLRICQHGDAKRKVGYHVLDLLDLGFLE